MKDSINKNIKIIPVVTYANFYVDKYKIYEENKRKSGIYRITNLVTGKSYIGSSKNLSKRFSVYYSIVSLKNSLDNSPSIIYSSLLKYGYDKFSLDIIEYCEIDVLIEREQYYFYNLKPEYNILKIAGSPLGKMRSDSTKEKIRDSMTGKNHPNFGKHHSYETRKKISKALKLSKRIFRMPKMRIETKLKLSLVSIGVSVKVYDSYDNLIKEFPSINSAAKYFDVGSTTINRVIKKGTSYQSFYFKSEIKDNRVWVYDLKHKLINVLDNTSKTSECFNIPTTTLFRYIKSGKLWKYKYYFYNTCLKT